MEFRISIGAYNEIFVCVEPTDKEYELLIECARNGDYSFNHVKGLEALYKRVRDAAYEEMADSVYYDTKVIEEHMGGKYNHKSALEYVKNTYSIEPYLTDEFMAMDFDEDDEFEEE